MALIWPPTALSISPEKRETCSPQLGDPGARCLHHRLLLLLPHPSSNSIGVLLKSRGDHITCISSLQRLCSNIRPGPDACHMCLVLSLGETLHTHPHKESGRQTSHVLPRVMESGWRALCAAERVLFPPLKSFRGSLFFLSLELKIFPMVSDILPDPRSVQRSSDIFRTAHLHSSWSLWSDPGRLLWVPRDMGTVFTRCILSFCVSQRMGDFKRG